MAQFYQSRGFTGAVTSLSAQTGNLGTLSNKFSSVKLTGNIYVVAFDGFNFTGNQMTIVDDIGDLGTFAFDKKIKSLRFFSMPTPSTVYYRAFNACCSFSAFSSGGSEYSCSGFFISADGYLVTAAHCVLSDIFNSATQRYDPLVDFYVAVSGVNETLSTSSANSNINKVFTARLVGYDQYADIAVLKVDGLTTQQFLQWGNSRQTPIGSRAYVLGNPQGNDEDSFAAGIVRDNRYSGEFPLFYVESVLVDTSIISGNSGGPLLNAIGQVIGLSNYAIGGKNDFGGGAAQYIAQKIVERIIAFDRAGRPQRTGYTASNPTLPVIPSTPSTNHAFILNDGSHIIGSFNCVLIQIPKWFIADYSINNNLYKGALVAGIDPSSTLVGTLAEGDIILSMDGQDIGLFKGNVSPHSVFVDKLPGSTVVITYIKTSEGYATVKTATVPLSRLPNSVNFDGELMRQTKEMVGEFMMSMRKK